MAEHSCCQRSSTPARENLKTGRVIGSTKWIVPTAVLALMPKCPLCVAAYIALATGFGVSLSVATWIRAGLMMLCLGALISLSIRMITRALDRRRFSISSMRPLVQSNESKEFLSREILR
jgi:hypothetical protein